MRESLKEFVEFGRDTTSLHAWVAKLAVSAPLLDLITQLGPPWPTRMGVSISISIAEILVLMFVFEFFHEPNHNIARVRQIMLIGLVAVIALFGVYMYYFAEFVYPAPDHWHRVVVGSEYIPQKSEYFEHKGQSPGELLGDNENMPAKIWTTQSIRGNRLKLLFTWILFWAALATVMAAFVIRRRSQAASPQEAV